MKRGNTALKRGVGLASAFALAIAGAVVAAPAASAWTAGGLDDTVRATPIADAGWILDNEVITKTTDYDATRDYATDGTGAVLNLSGNASNQPASGLQIAIPVAAGAPSWSAGDKIVVKLTTPKVTWASAPHASISVLPVADATGTGVNGLDKFAGYNSGDSAHAATADPGASAVKLSTPTLARSLQSDSTEVAITLPDPTGVTGLTANYSYLVSLDDVRLSVAKDFDGTTDSAINVSVSGTGTTPAASSAATAATIGYVTPFQVSTTGAYPANTSKVALPDITVTEQVAKAFVAGNYVLSVSADKADTTKAQVVEAGTSKASADNFTATTGTVTGSDIPVVLADAATKTIDNEKIESFTVSGITVTNVKAGADVTVTLTDPHGVALDPNATTAEASAMATTPNQVGGPSVTVSSEVNPPRIAGTDRYDTSAQIAKAFAKTSAFSGKAVVVANGESFKNGADALSANFLAGAKGAPILLTTANTLPETTQLALVDLFKNSAADITVYFMGKTDSVSTAVRDKVVSTLKASINAAGSVTAKEVAGDDRYETSAKTANEVGFSGLTSYNFGKGFVKTAFLASGTVNADALAAGALSVAAGVPVLLTTAGDALPASVQSAIDALSIKQVFILGSTDRVSQKVEDALTTAGVAVVRVAGTGAEGRYDTAVAINKLAFKAQADGGFGLDINGTTGYLASGTLGWPDALSVGPLAGANHSPLLTVPVSSLPTSTKGFLTDNAGKITAIEALGASDRITSDVITEAQKAILK